MQLHPTHAAIAAAGLFALSLTAPSLAATPGSRDGIARAERAGITIDPAAKRIMAAAPLGSCINDPTRVSCDTPTAIVADGRPFADGSTAYADAAPATTALAAAVGHRTSGQAAAFPQCFVKATSLVKSTGYARAYGQNNCSSAVQEMELYVTLREHWTSDGQWHQMDVGHTGPKYGGGTLNAHAEYPCRSSSTRAWEDLVSGYAEVNGVWYAGENKLDENLSCVG